MRNLNLSRCALSVCVAALSLAGCSQTNSTLRQANVGIPPSGMVRTTPHISLPGVAGPERVGLDASAKEDLIGTAVVYCGSGVTESFTASGTATGPYAGAFNASGEYHASRGGGAWFQETFTIYSGTLQVSGEIPMGGFPNPPSFACPKFGPVVFPYTSDYGSGNAKITIRRRKHAFRERLSGL